MLYSLGSQAGVVVINLASTTNVVGGLNFSRSQPDFEGFRWVLSSVFPPHQKIDSLHYIDSHKFIS